MRNSKRQDSVFDHIAKHPGCTTHEIGEALGIDANNAAAACTHLMDRQKVERKEVRRLASNRPVFAYWAKTPESTETLVPSETGVARNVFSRGKSAPEVIPQLGGVEALLDGLANTIAGQLAETLAEKVRARLTDKISTFLPSVIQSFPTAAAQEQAREPVQHQVGEMEKSRAPVQQTLLPPEKLARVGIVGLYPNQQREIEAEFGTCFRMTFWTHNDWGTLRAIAQHCEVAFVLVRHVSHRTTEHLRSNGARILTVEGSVSALKVAMTEFYLHREAA